MSKYDVEQRREVDPALKNPPTLAEMSALLTPEDVATINTYQTDEAIDPGIRIGSPIPDDITDSNPRAAHLLLNSVIDIPPETQIQAREDHITHLFRSNPSKHDKDTVTQALRARRTIVALMAAQQVLPDVIRPINPTGEIIAERLHTVKPGVE